MRFRKDNAEFDQQCLQVLLRRLLTVKTDQVMVWFCGLSELRCPVEIGFCFAEPLPGFSLHRALFPASPPAPRKYHPRINAARASPAYEQSSQVETAARRPDSSESID